jgi:hypothetical protein
MPEGLNIIERARLTRRLQVNQRRLDKLDALFAGQPVGTARFQDLAITLAKITNVSANKIITGTLQVGEKILISDGTNNRILITRDDIRISKEGIDVEKTITETNKKDFILLSLTELHKLRYAGIVTGGSYTHDLDRIPVFFVWRVNSSTNPTEFYAYLDSRASTTQITNMPSNAYLMIFNEGDTP